MSKILYIIGAGASANVLPIINSFRDEVGQIRPSLTQELLNFTSKISDFEEYRVYYDLCLESMNFVTPDTFAKFLYVTNRDRDYVRFKQTISTYFFWKEEFTGNCFDTRILSFLTTLSDSNGMFPNNIKVISWNYDRQFIKAIELANSKIPNQSFIHNFKRFPLNYDRVYDELDLPFIHLNGIAGYSFNERLQRVCNKLNDIDLPSQSLSDFFEKNKMTEAEVIKYIFRKFDAPNEHLLISYAWEKEHKSQRDYKFSSQKVEYSRVLARASEILVVIGYSFPFFNREIDKIIFSEMPELKKIYFQDPILNGDFLYSQFNLDRNRVKIEHVPNTKNYYVPYEL